MTNVWFTSDTHFGHANIIKYCSRPFASVEEMDEAMIQNWNALAKQGDLVYHLGDFCMGDHNVEKYIRCLSGQIHLIWGNHDKESTRNFAGFASSVPYREIHLGGIHITLCHYALKVWNKSHLGSISLYGHNHGRLQGNSQSLDVGVDAAWDFMPVNLDQILARMKLLKPYERK